jgi:PIN domain nuclease of toxin-antitoxin system
VFRRALLESGYLEMAITSAHAAAVASVPQLHKDPFDRILVAQAMVEGVTLLSTDPAVLAYPGPIRSAL